MERQLLDLPDDILLLIFKNIFEVPTLNDAWPHDEWEEKFSPRPLFLNDDEFDDRIPRARANNGLNFFLKVLLNHETFVSKDFKNVRLTCKRFCLLMDSFSRYKTKLPEINRYMLVIQKPWDDGSVFHPHSATIKLALDWISKYDSDNLWKSKDAHPEMLDPGLRAISKYPPQTICCLITTAHKFEHRVLREAGCEAMSELIKGKTHEQIRETFNIRKDLPPEEEQKINSYLQELL
eukprot:m.3522 g.3522  ORF g.3522 m.3522 type:complete len:236 (-) comp2783_c0_seq1:2-709(-)